ncbi:hypothetical protein ACFL58_04285 [Elusimicrobiota bacterium]
MKITRIAILLSLILSQNTLLFSSNFEYSGYYKAFYSIVVPPSYSNPLNLTVPETSSVLKNIFRFKAYYEKDDLSLNLAYSFAPIFQDSDEVASFTLNTNSNDYRFIDANTTLYGPENNFRINQNLDRAFLKIRSEKSDLYIGRQAIAWGNARAVNPTDVLLPYRFDELDTEERTGVDAVRLRITNEDGMGEIDLGYIAGKDLKPENSALFVRDRFQMLDSDVSLLLINFKENLLAGLDIAKSIGGAGFWLETGYVFAKYFKDYENFKNSDYLRLSTGIDYSFDKIYCFLEYHYNEAGTTDPGNYVSNSSNLAYTDGSVFFLGKNYIVPSVSYQLTGLMSVSGTVFANLDDSSFFISPSFSYNIFENVYVAVSAFAGVGDGPEIAAGNTTRLNSEFGSYPIMYFSSLKLYF